MFFGYIIVSQCAQMCVCMCVYARAVAAVCAECAVPVLVTRDGAAAAAAAARARASRLLLHLRNYHRRLCHALTGKKKTAIFTNRH